MATSFLCDSHTANEVADEFALPEDAAEEGGFIGRRCAGFGEGLADGVGHGSSSLVKQYWCL